MSRKIKLLGVALAMLALGVVVASAAQAKEFTAAKYTATLSGSQTTEHTFSYEGRTIKCATSTLTGTIAAKSKAQTLTPKFEKCTATILGNAFPATVVMGGCDFKFTSTPETQIHIECPAGADIAINAYQAKSTKHEVSEILCRYTVAAQAVKGASFLNQGEGVLFTANVIEVAATRTIGSAAMCGAASSAEVSYLGSTLVTGLDSGGAVDKYDMG